MVSSRHPELLDLVAVTATSGEPAVQVGDVGTVVELLGRPNRVRERTGTAMDLEHWDRRALIWAGQTLSRKERRVWLAPFERAEDPRDRAVARHALGER